MNLFRNKTLWTVDWKDLTQLSFREAFIENSISIPWLVLSWIFACAGYYLLALPCSFLFFLTGLRQVHNAYHYTLGISKRATWIVLFLNSIIMVTAMHAVKYTHLQHHKHCLSEEDIEGGCAKMSGFLALLYGPVFIYKMHKSALNSGSGKTVKYVLSELAAIPVFITIVFVLDIKFLEYHIITMIFGEFMTAFFAVWTVHHHCDETNIARTLRSGWKNFFTYNMFYHLEHHLFPQVPTIKLPALARRLDEKMPDLKKKQVF